MATDPTGTKRFALEHADRFLAWDCVYLQISSSVLGEVKRQSLQEISIRTGRDPRWGYKMMREVQKRLRK